MKKKSLHVNTNLFFLCFSLSFNFFFHFALNTRQSNINDRLKQYLTYKLFISAIVSSFSLQTDSHTIILILVLRI